MRSVMVLIAMALVLIAGWDLGVCRWGQESSGPMIAEHQAPTIQQIQALSQLVTERVTVNEVIESHLAGRTGSITAVVVVRGSLLISTDLSRAHFESVDESVRRIVLVLPQPTILQSAVDHDQTHVFTIRESGLWEITPNDNVTSAAIVDLAYHDAQRFVADAAKDGDLLVRARQHAEQMLRQFFREGKWQLIVKWLD